MARIVVVNFARYHPASREITSSARGNGKLKWVRLETDWHHDPVVAELPADERFLWPLLLAEAGKGHPHGIVEATPSQLATMARVSEAKVRHALSHLRKRGRIATEPVTEPPR